MNCLTRLHPYMVPSMTDPEPAFCTFQGPLFETARNDAHEDVLISPWLSGIEPRDGTVVGRVAAAANEEGPVEQIFLQIENCRINEEDVIAQEVKFAVKEFVTTNT